MELKMCEKRIETQLDHLLRPFNQSCIYYSPNENMELKKIFNKASKKGASFGIPDRIYFDHKTLIVFECKKTSMNNAVNDLKIYHLKIKNETLHYNLFFVAVIEDAYEIYNDKFQKQDFILSPFNFNLKEGDYSCELMEKDIHKIHNYIRDHTKISNEDKSFFIACILVSLKKKSFYRLLENYDTKKYIYDFISQSLKEYDIDISVFEFLRNDENNIHFYNIIKMVEKVYNKKPSSDLLHKFYNEFVRYGNTDSKSLGIVLTPDHVVKLMIELLEINEDDVFLDLCSGTGSFVLEALRYNPKSIIAIEYQNKLFSLLKCNLILRDVDVNTNKIIKGDCFNYNYQATKSAINPPFGMSDKIELDFIIKQLDCVPDGGLVAAVIPKSKFNSNAVNNKFKKHILEIGHVKTIINCNPKLFEPIASIECCIIIIEKSINKDLTKIIDYSEDGVETLLRNGKIKTHEFDSKYENIIKQSKQKGTVMLASDLDWCYADKTLDGNGYIDFTTRKLKIAEETHLKEREKILNSDNRFYFKNWRYFKIGDLFHVGKKPMETYTKKELVNVVAAKNNNNGVKGKEMSDINTFSGNKIAVVTGGNGGAGLAFYQSEDFKIKSSTAVLSPKSFKLDNDNGEIMSCILSDFKNKYSFTYQWNLERIKNDVIKLPITQDECIDYELLKQLYSRCLL
jgi:predicted RNA methylase